jgi:hypothetical protein
MKHKEKLMPTVKEMAEAHLGNVQKAIAELEQQKLNIDNEILKLKEYFEIGKQTLEKPETAEVSQ